MTLLSEIVDVQGSRASGGEHRLSITNDKEKKLPDENLNLHCIRLSYSPDLP